MNFLRSLETVSDDDFISKVREARRVNREWFNHPRFLEDLYLDMHLRQLTTLRLMEQNRIFVS